MNVAVVHISCGRWEYQARTLASFIEQVRYPWSDVVHVHDSDRQGGSWSIEEAWRQIRDTDADYVFHLEDDWTFPDAVPVDALVDICESNMNLANVVLRRQPVGLEGAGGYIGDDGPSFTERDCYGTKYLEHNKGFWLNPCLYPAEIPRRYKWPRHATEGDFTRMLHADEPKWRFAVFGKRHDQPRAIHIGDVSARGVW